MCSFCYVYVVAKRADQVHTLIKAKDASGLSYTEIARRVGLTNGYVAQLFHRQVNTYVHVGSAFAASSVPFPSLPLTLPV